MDDEEFGTALGRRFSQSVLNRARRLSPSGKLAQDAEHPSVWWVTGSTGTRYRVQMYPTDVGLPVTTCTCPNGMNVSEPICNHVAAVLLAARAAGEI